MKFLTDINNEKYTEFIKSHKHGNMMQAIEWSAIKNTWGAVRVAVSDDEDNIIAAAQVLTRKGLWYVPRGPILDYNNKELLGFFLTNLKKFAKTKQAKLVKLDIPIAVKDEKLANFKDVDVDRSNDELIKTFKSYGYNHKGFSLDMSSTIQPRFNTVTKLEQPVPDLFSKDTRRLIRDADKKFVEVRRCGKENLDDFLFALACTEKRKNISLRGREYFENLLDTFGDNALLYISYINVEKALKECHNRKENLEKEIEELGEKSPKKKRTLEEQVAGTEKLITLFNGLEIEDKSKDQVISAAITIAYGNHAEIIYAGMNEDFAKLPAQYKVFSDTMKKAQEMGISEVSMGGIEGSLNDSLLGFKSKFSPNIVEYYGEFDLVISHVFNLMYNYGLPLRRKILKLIHR
ncbi:peptidoglycan bridge formation glycyltransferase FemA/FemB family protein [Gemella sanguinis]|jgi:putative aminoacyltransferase femX|uniref:peptidoglycan bridge formation glycyltransferase FemA/FemB family protein n=1 Tax=Gemella sanguinis TaxID=84135 RepID=UPI0004E1C267|nr:peptidoglycan bridge formation glycyltransferase FemA/FemB family protein [Gemella sanguinis]NKZ26104.1 aminoacyltransferase [Gemella sanguinis]